MNLEDGIPSFTIEVDFLKGAKGDTGFSPRIEVASLTSAEYILKIINEDGTFYTPNLKGDLSMDDYVLKEQGKGLSANSFEDEEKQKLQELQNYDDTDVKASIITLQTNLEQKIGNDIEASQQELIDDMSKTYTGTNITAPTVEGYGRVNKIYGHTVEEGTGEKSPTNPYTLKSVADDVNLFDMNWLNTRVLNKSGNLTNTIPMTFESGTYTASNLLENGSSLDFTSTVLVPIFSSGQSSVTKTLNGTFSITEAEAQSIIGIKIYYNGSEHAGVRIKEIKLQKGSVATPYSPYGKGTVENISKNGDQQSSNIIMTEPLYSVENFQDEIDCSKGQINKIFDKKTFNGSEDWWAGVSYENCMSFETSVPSKYQYPQTCSHFKYINNYQLDEPHMYMYNNVMYVFVPKTIASTVEQFKTWLASNPIEVIYASATPLIRSIDCSNKLVQYEGETTVSNRDGAKIEVSLTNNEAISGLNEDIGNVGNNIRQVSNYSIEEKVVGTWMDKPIYRRVIDLGAMPNNTSKAVSLNINNVDKIIKIEGAMNSDIRARAIPFSGLEIQIVRDNSTVSSLQLTTSVNLSTYTGQVALEYTKTTD